MLSDGLADAAHELLQLSLHAHDGQLELGHFVTALDAEANGQVAAGEDLHLGDGLLQRPGHRSGDEPACACRHHQADAQQHQQLHLRGLQFPLHLGAVLLDTLALVGRQGGDRADVGLGRRGHAFGENLAGACGIAGLEHLEHLVAGGDVGAAFGGHLGQQLLAAIAVDGLAQVILPPGDLGRRCLDQRVEVLDHGRVVARLGDRKGARRVQFRQRAPLVGHAGSALELHQVVQRFLAGHQACVADGHHQRHERQHESEAESQPRSRLDPIEIHRGLLSMGTSGVLESERGHDTGQPRRLFLKALGGGGGLLHQRGVLLCHLVELVDGGVHLADALALFGRRQP
jgi:hypothetical protein